MTTRETKIALALVVVVALYIASRTKQGGQVISDVTDSIASGVIGYRLNNPLNVERGQPWDGLADVQDNARFAAFIDMPHGVRAAAIILRNYQRFYGIRTVEKIVNRWNPPSDGQPSSYIPNVADYLGVPSTLSLDLEDRSTMFALLRGMMEQEIGSVAALLVSDDDVQAGLTLAGFA
jgi:hypothetical protein